LRTLLAVLAFGAVAAAQARVEGRVMSTNGEPVRKATVRLGGGQPTVTYVEVSGADGRFVFENVAPARYLVTAQKAGYAPLASGTVPGFVLAGGESKRDVEIRLTPNSVVTGVVTDFDGDPVSNVQIQLMRRAYTQGRMRLQAASAGSTDDRGRFRVTGVAPGRYYVLANDQAARNVGASPSEIRGRSALDVNLSTYHPGSDLAGAALIDVKGGAELSNVDIRMRRGRVYTARGTAVDESGAPVQAMVTLYQKSDEGPTANMSAQSRQGTGVFEFRGLAPGEYTMLVRYTPPVQTVQRPPTGQPPVVTFQPARAGAPSENLTGRLDFSIGSSDLENLTIRLTQGAEVTGRLRMDGGGDLTAFLQSAASNTPRATVLSPDGQRTASVMNPPTVSLVSDEGTMLRSAIAVAQDGTFRISNLTPAKYMVSVGPLAPGAYVKSIRWGAQEFSNTLLDLTSGNGGVMEIVVSPNGAGLNGVARNGQGEVVGNVMVTVWPAIRVVTDSAGGVHNLRTSAQGTFQLRGLSPGEYYVAVWDEVSQDLSRIPEFLDLFRAAATKVSLAEGETASIESRPISRDTVEKAVEQFR